MAETFGQRLRALRTERGMSRQELAAKLGLTYFSVVQYERDERAPRPEVLARIADILSVSLDYLMGRTNDPTPYTAHVDWPEGLRAIRRAGKRLTEQDKKMILDIIQWVTEKEKEAQNPEITDDDEEGL